MPASDSVVAKGTGLQTAGLNVACKIPGCCETQQVSIELFVGNSHTSIRKPKLPTGAYLYCTYQRICILYIGWCPARLRSD